MDVENAPDRLRGMPSWLFGQLSIKARRTTGAVMDGHGLHRSQYALLSSLEQFGPSSQTELGERSGLDRSDVVKWVDELEARGFVVRNRDPKDRRRNVISLSSSGRRILVKLDGELAAAQERLLANLNARERDQLTRLLRRALGSG